jgi:2-polyprenyl-3-methyl-5-hydroxy-6-metoxy-1,4-benzoquinol methylase
MSGIWKQIRRIIRDPGRLRRAKLQRMPNVIHAGRRALCTKVETQGTNFEYFKKKFEDTAQGRSSFEREMEADRLFGSKPWKPLIKDKGPLWFTTPLYPEASRLDVLAAGLDQPTRIEIAKQAISILFDIFFAGYAHRDFHSKNLFWLDHQLMLIDYECIEPYPQGKRPPFPLAYDITGEGLESPFITGKMCYTCEKRGGVSLYKTTGISVEQAIEEFQNDFKEKLRQACCTFATKTWRHTCRAERIYSSFELPFFSVRPDEAQRDSAVRLRDFGVTEQIIKGKKVLDLGCNIGGTLLALQKYNPGHCLGVEYDSEKVLLAKQIAAYNGLNNVKFVAADVDLMTAQQMDGPYDVVFCLALEAHVKDPKKLFELLSQVTAGVLYFEGNSTTNPRKVKKILAKSGFRDVKMLGMCKDDVLAGNNRRPMFVATK